MTAFRLFLIRVTAVLSALSPLAATAAPTAPTIDPATATFAERAAVHAEGWPITVGFFLMLCAMGYLIRWLITKFWPEWQATQAKRAETAAVEAEKTRDHMSRLMRERDEAAGQREKTIIEGLGGKVERVIVVTQELSGRISDTNGRLAEVNQRVSGVYEIVRVVAGKVGVGGLIMVLAGAMALQHAANATRRVKSVAIAGKRAVPTVTAAAAIKPDCSGIGGCATPSWCCKTNVCCRRTLETPKPPQQSVAAAGQPHSDAWILIDYGEYPWAEQEARRLRL